MSIADALIGLVLVGFGVPLIVVDTREHRLPDRLTGPAALSIVAIAGVAAIATDTSRLVPMLLTALVMAAAGYLLAVLNPAGFGLGDVKLLGVLGLALGHLEVSSVVLWLLALAVATLGWLLLAPRFDRKLDRGVPFRKREIAFGPPLIIAAWVVWLVWIGVSLR